MMMMIKVLQNALVRDVAGRVDVLMRGRVSTVHAQLSPYLSMRHSYHLHRTMIYLLQFFRILNMCIVL